jgi:hypothetical protein
MRASAIAIHYSLRELVESRMKHASPIKIIRLVGQLVKTKKILNSPSLIIARANTN